MATPLTLASQISALQRAGKLPATISAAQRGHISRWLNSLAPSAQTSALDNSLNKILRTLESIANPVDMGGTLTGFNPATANTELTGLLESFGTPEAASETARLPFVIKTNADIHAGRLAFVAQNALAAQVDLFPAWEFKRFYDRDLPRGQRRAGKTVMAVPEEAWDTADGRWVAACEQAGDERALKVFRATGRMVARKSSGVWQALGDGAGGYTDTLNNPFPPFAFNSGFDVEEVDRQEAEDLGLLDVGAAAEPAEIDFGKIFQPIEEAA